jgi:hypothetical protein
VREAGGWLTVPTLVLSAITVAIGLGFPFVLTTLLGGGQ